MKGWMVIALLLLSAPGLATAEGTRVAVVASGEAALPLSQRLEAELAGLSFDPRSVERDVTALAGPGVAEIAAGTGSAVVLVVQPGLDAVGVWAVDAGTGLAVLRATISQPDEHPSIAALAIRTAEHLRAEMIEVAEAPPERPAAEAGPVLEPPGLEAAELRQGWSQRRLELGLGAGLLWSPGGVGVSGQVLVELRWVPRRWLSVHLLGLAPMVPAAVTGPEGRARIWPGMVGGGLGVRIAPASRRVGGTVEAGAAAVVLGMEGEANSPYRSQGDRVWAAGPYLRPRLVVRLTSRLQLGLDVLVGLATPRPVVRFASRDAASWGLPFLLACLSLGALVL